MIVAITLTIIGILTIKNNNYTIEDRRPDHFIDRRQVYDVDYTCFELYLPSDNEVILRQRSDLSSE